MTEQGTIQVELSGNRIKLTARTKEGREGSINLPINLAEDLGEGLIRLVRKYEQIEAENPMSQKWWIK